MISVCLTRESVATSDDVWAPHEWQFLVHPPTTLGELIQIAIDEHYLANITGGRAAWVAEAGARPVTLLAVVAQQWPQAGWLAAPTQSLVDVPGAYDSERQRAELHFRYHGQRDPQDLLNELAASAVGDRRSARTATPTGSTVVTATHADRPRRGRLDQHVGPVCARRLGFRQSSFRHITRVPRRAASYA